ncbi:MAG: DNA polymerase III subunit gamma/tau [Patescibacteria group bacterium]|nr:DNA polymerase III subunit gamma/tau [Patescibacteria group bacterium]
MVFYRTYRPQTIEELDSEEIRKTLFSVLSGKDNPHAFLFSGPRGLGKTSTARIVAKVLNCEKKSKTSIEPCNKCDQCVSITNGTNLDVLEIDGASNRGIDEIRDLREKIRLLPVSAKKKVYIIDEVHMLTTEAFNALLKTLEEPPPHAVFILCTTELHKVPATILSRCFHVNFKSATTDELKRSFKRIAQREKIKVKDEVLEKIAYFAEGSFRDGVKVLEELTLSAKGEITIELLEKRYQVTSVRQQALEMLELLAKKDIKKSLELIQKLPEQGTNAKYFIEQIVSKLHSLLLTKVGIENNSVRLSPDQNSELSVEEIKKLVELFTRAYGELKYAVLPQLPLELVVIEWCVQSKNDDEVAQKDSSRLPQVGSDVAGRIVLRSPSQFSESSNASVPAVASGDLGIRSDVHRSLAKTSLHENAPRTIKSGQTTSSKHDNIWQELIEKIKPHNHSVAGVLRGCILKDFDGKRFTIEAKFKFHKERLENRKVTELIEKIIKEITGKDVSVNVSLRKV